ncbi:histidine kinase [Micromonospora sp. WMMD1102]|uniref:sensor histidine kinase n=1 Tax=Micromonospora sp. WMMD1102 TaxID=3016105 RepID=UPI0024151D2B|nr:histidine kinase [Micromonospora sp. WMMD1102]MDG4789357.1 histidine kinase [Micromonospora sp. WMMD1102]
MELARRLRWPGRGRAAASAGTADVDGGRATARRTVRDWVVDSLLFGLALFFWAWTWRSAPMYYFDSIPGWMVTIDPWVGAVGCLALWWRRRFPILLGVAMVLVLMLAATGLGAALVAVLSVAVHRNWLPATLVTVLHVGPSLSFGYENPPPGVTRWAYLTLILLMYLVPLGWGIAVRARRQLIANLRREVDRARNEHRQRLAGARRAERERIAREMHDVLAHRISLISVHAGALAYRTAQADAGAGAPLGAAEVGGAIEVIRDNARQALVELGDVLAVLRPEQGDRDGVEQSEQGDRDGVEQADPEVGTAGQETGTADEWVSHRSAPQPRLADIFRLVQEAQVSGQRVSFEMVCAPGAAESLRPAMQRTVYRTVQEGLTNARKHAGQTEVTVRVEIEPGTGIVATITNPLPSPLPLPSSPLPSSPLSAPSPLSSPDARGRPAEYAAQAAVDLPGAGAGLTGLAERLALDGGTIEHGVVGGTFRLRTRLPWPA